MTRSSGAVPLAVVGGLLVLLLAVAGGVGLLGGNDVSGASAPSSHHAKARHDRSGPPRRSAEPVHPPRPGAPATNSTIFAHNTLLVAYYGTAGTGSLGVLGETPPEVMQQRLARAASAFRSPTQPVRPVYELIVTVADSFPGPDGTYSHDIDHALVRRYITAAHRHHALLLLDLQPGRSDFLTVAQRWAWALRDPSVGLALDPEWRMHGAEVPARTIGWVGAREVNRVSLALQRFDQKYRLPEKLFLVHQFRRDMVRAPGSANGIERVLPRPGLAEVQHVDGFGTPGQKLATFHSVAAPHRFFLGFKLFYDEDRPLMTPRTVTRLHPDVRFVSFQ